MGRTIEHLRPSRAATWSVCSGSIEMAAMFPAAPDDADNDVAEDGTACHWLAAEVLAGRFPQEGTLAPNGRVLTEEMFDAVDLYVATVRSEFWRDAITEVEQPVDCSAIYPGMSGTPDVSQRRPDMLRVADLKFGFRFVEVWDNLQLIIYALALAALHKLPDDMLVELCIIQPRSWHRDGQVRAWTTKIGTLRAKFLPLLQARAKEVMEGRPQFLPNPGCLDCPGRHICIALQNSALTQLEVAYGMSNNELSPAALGNELARLKDGAKKMEARITGLEAQAEHLLRAGKVVPGWSLQPTTARETWQPGAEQAIIAIAREHFGVDVARPQKAITPNQARHLLPTAIVANYAHKPSTGVKLKKQDPYAARKVFGEIE